MYNIEKNKQINILIQLHSDVFIFKNLFEERKRIKVNIVIFIPV